MVCRLFFTENNPFSSRSSIVTDTDTGVDDIKSKVDELKCHVIAKYEEIVRKNVDIETLGRGEINDKKKTHPT